MRVLGIDQSLSKCAFMETVDGEPVNYHLAKTGSSGVKTKRKDTVYFDELESQIHFICNHMEVCVNNFNPDIIVFEALSFGSAGDATRNLACLFGAMNEVIKRLGWEGDVIKIPPTSLKSYAHQFLPEGEKWEGKTKAGKLKKVKIDKKVMVSAARNLMGEDFLKEYNYSTGLDDLTDAFFLAHKVYHEKKKP